MYWRSITRWRMRVRPRTQAPCMRVMRRHVRIAENAKQHDKENYRYLHPCPPPRLPQYITAPQQLSQLPPAMAHSHTPPAASAPLDSPPDSAASAASVDSGACSKVSRTMLEDCESDESLEDAPPLWKKQNTRMDVKDADINADINADIIPPSVRRTRGMFTLVVLWRGLSRTLSSSLATYNRQTKSVAVCISEA